MATFSSAVADRTYPAQGLEHNEVRTGLWNVEAAAIYYPDSWGHLEVVRYFDSDFPWTRQLGVLQQNIRMALYIVHRRDLR